MFRGALINVEWSSFEGNISQPGYCGGDRGSKYPNDRKRMARVGHPMIFHGVWSVDIQSPAMHRESNRRQPVGTARLGSVLREKKHT